jgi:anthranilate synthase component II
MKKILVIDNYDSFVYNLVHYIEKISGNLPDVYRNDKISLEEIAQYDKILLSPGPGIPSEAGLLLEIIKTYAATKSMIGVCLGHQAIAEVFGGKLVNLDKVYHGVATPIKILYPDEPLFAGIPSEIEVGRYHSWVAERKSLPDCFHITCEDETGLVMGICHKTYDLRGVQFHPESVLTPHGLKMIENWLNL